MIHSPQFERSHCSKAAPMGHTEAAAAPGCLVVHISCPFICCGAVFRYLEETDVHLFIMHSFERNVSCLFKLFVRKC